MLYSSKNVGVTLTIPTNSAIIKGGKVVPVSKLEKGDKIKAMLDVNIKETTGDKASYILIVEE